MRIIASLIVTAACVVNFMSVVHADSDERSTKSRASSKPQSTTPATAAPAATAKPAAAAAATGSAFEGRRAYLKFNCYSCHGMGATGSIAPNIVRADAGDVREAVLEGKDEGMPSYRAYVSSAHIDNLTAYLRSIGTAAEPKFVDWWVPVPTK